MFVYTGKLFVTFVCYWSVEKQFVEQLEDFGELKRQGSSIVRPEQKLYGCKYPRKF